MEEMTTQILTISPERGSIFSKWDSYTLRLHKPPDRINPESRLSTRKVRVRKGEDITVTISDMFSIEREVNW